MMFIVEGGKIYDKIVFEKIAAMQTKEISYPGFGSFAIYVTNSVLKFRAKSFLTKEPTTLDWIKSLEKDSILIDVGANIGIYTIPCALFHVMKVIAIEPEIRNYNMLLNNLDLNNISNERVEALPVAISTQHAEKFTKIFLTEDVVGSSCHQVGRNQDHLLRKNNNSKRKSRSVYCVSLASIVRQASANHNGPIHIKVDVDGIEEDVCQSLFDSKMINRISSLQIELNPKISQHYSLIEKLHDAGFSYSEKQVALSKRKSGDFEGFAEIVFRRTISLEALKVLPKEVSEMLGENYVPCSFPQKKADCSNLFNLSQSRLVRLSRMPTSFVLKKSFDSRRSSSIFSELCQKALLESSNSFHFQSDKDTSYSNQRRIILNNSLLRQHVPGYLDSLIDECRSSGLAARVNKMSEIASGSLFPQPYLSKNHPGSENKYIEKMNMYCRIRHFVDLFGYTLGRHNDSLDTYCALIAPILPGSTSTSLISGSFFRREVFANLNDPISENMYKNDFSNDLYYVDSECGAYADFTYSEKHGIYSQRFPYSLHMSDVRPGEMIGIPNPMWVAVGSDVKNTNLGSTYHFRNQFGHGVFPAVSEPYRPVLLIDFILMRPHNEPVESSERILIDLGNARDFMKSSSDNSF